MVTNEPPSSLAETEHVLLELDHTETHANTSKATGFFVSSSLSWMSARGSSQTTTGKMIVRETAHMCVDEKQRRTCWQMGHYVGRLLGSSCIQTWDGPLLLLHSVRVCDRLPAL